MIDISVINLDKDVDRKISIEEQFNKQKIEFTFIKGVYGSKLVKKGLQNFSTNGQLGCFSSHRNAWKRIKKEKIEYAVVCEDDIEIPNNFIGELEKILEKYEDKNWEIITFNKIIGIYPFNKFITSCCYLINGKHIDKLLKLNKYGHVDLTINFSSIKVNYEDIGLKLKDFDSNNCPTLSNGMNWYINMPWFIIPMLDITINVKTFILFSLMLFFIFYDYKINIVFSLLVLTFFYIMCK